MSHDPRRHETRSEATPSPAFAAATDDGPSHPTADAPDSTAAPDAPPGYALRELIGRGGMGDVYRARDLHLNRDVAVKLLQAHFSAHSVAARRFLEEAQITGQLQHPGIPPIHQVGTLPDGRPFLAMKLIKGETLAQRLANPSSPVATGELVPVFEAICQAVGYAHEHGVIHRDLKPGNVMVGAFGEVQVMDWGLAKVLRHAEPGIRNEDPEQTTDLASVPNSEFRIPNSELTRAGSVLGTPAFMPPEQAIGAVDQLDARSDAFGLGAILCVLLTSRPPYIGANAESTRQLAARAKLDDAFARLDSSGADPELVALCKRCLSAEKADRPANGGEVAQAVAALRTAADERARHAELDRARIEATAAVQRKKRNVQLALAAAVLVIVAGGAAFAWWQDQQADERRLERERVDGEKRDADFRQALERDRQAAHDRDRLARNAATAESLLDRCADALEANDAALAAPLLKSARTQAEQGGADRLATRFARLEKELAALRALDVADQFRWTPLDSRAPKVTDLTARYRAALALCDADPLAVPPEDAARRIAAATIRKRLVAALDWMLVGEPAKRVRAALRLADANAFRDAVRDAILADDGDALRALAAEPEAAAQPAEFIAVLGSIRAIAAARRRVLLLAAVRRNPDELQLLMALGGTYPLSLTEGVDDRIRWYQAAVAAAPKNAAAHNNLGIALANKGDVAGALAEYQAAARLDPNYSQAHNNVGSTLSVMGDKPGALAAFRDAVRVDPSNAKARNNLGIALATGNEPEEALAQFRESVRLDPTNPRAQSNLGLALFNKQDWTGAIAHCRAALALEPNNAEAHNILGSALASTGDIDEALTHFQEAVRLRPKDALFQKNLDSAKKQKAARDAARPAAPKPREVKRSNRPPLAALR